MNFRSRQLLLIVLIVQVRRTLSAPVGIRSSPWSEEDESLPKPLEAVKVLRSTDHDIVVQILRPSTAKSKSSNVSKHNQGEAKQARQSATERDLNSQKRTFTFVSKEDLDVESLEQKVLFGNSEEMHSKERRKQVRDKGKMEIESRENGRNRNEKNFAVKFERIMTDTEDVIDTEKRVTKKRENIKKNTNESKNKNSVKLENVTPFDKEIFLPKIHKSSKTISKNDTELPLPYELETSREKMKISFLKNQNSIEIQPSPDSSTTTEISLKNKPVRFSKVQTPSIFDQKVSQEEKIVQVRSPLLDPIKDLKNKLSTKPQLPSLFINKLSTRRQPEFLMRPPSYPLSGSVVQPRPILPPPPPHSHPLARAERATDILQNMVLLVNALGKIDYYLSRSARNIVDVLTRHTHEYDRHVNKRQDTYILDKSGDHFNPDERAASYVRVRTRSDNDPNSGGVERRYQRA